MRLRADSTEVDAFDAVVIGAGAGGMAAAARLNHYGYRTLLVEGCDRVGGRASTVDIDGFRVNTGALVMELGGDNGRLFDEIGVDMGTRVARKPLVLRIGRRHLPLMSGLTGVVFRGLLAGVGAAVRGAGVRPERGRTTAEWLDGLHAGPYVHGLVRNLTSAVFAAEPSDVEAALFVDYLTKKNALKTYALHPEGTIGPWRALAAHYGSHGGVLWLDSEATAFTFGDDGLVDGVLVRREGEDVRVATRLVVSNAGPVATVGMCGDAALPPGYAEQVRARSNPSTLITINFASRERLVPTDGLMFFGPTRRLAYAATFTDTCPEMAPPGWHLHLAACVPHPATGPFDADAEVALLKQDLREQFPDSTPPASSRSRSVRGSAGPRSAPSRGTTSRGPPRSPTSGTSATVSGSGRPRARAGAWSRPGSSPTPSVRPTPPRPCAPTPRCGRDRRPSRSIAPERAVACGRRRSPSPQRYARPFR